MKFALLALLPSIIFAHEGDRLAPHDVATAWAWDPAYLPWERRVLRNLR